jgi:hypothetical protein
MGTSLPHLTEATLMERQLFIKHMTELGYVAFMPSNIILGFCLDNGNLYIGYDESQDKPYFIASQENFKILYRSFSSQSICNMLLRLEIPYQDSRFYHSEFNRFKLRHNSELGLEISLSEIYVTSQNKIIATFHDVSYDYIVEFVLMLGVCKK